MYKKNNHLVEVDLFQLHYYLKNNSHSMDALTLNKVEAEFLKIVNEVSKIFNYEIVVESKAIEEGGVISVYKFLTNTDNLMHVATVSAFVAVMVRDIITKVISDNINKDSKLNKLEKKKIKLEIQDLQDKKEQNKLIKEKSQLEIEKLKQEIYRQGLEVVENRHESQQKIEVQIDKKELDEKIEKVIDSTKIKIHKSSLYKNLANESKVEKFSTQILNTKGHPISDEKIVLRENFKNYIFKEEALEPKYLTDVELEIISPVLKNHKLTWKAIYEGTTISFSVKDEDFKNLIINKGLNFNNGTKLLCDLEIKLKMQPDGEIKETSKTAYNVTQIIYSNGDIVDV